MVSGNSGGHSNFPIFNGFFGGFANALSDLKCKLRSVIFVVCLRVHLEWCQSHQDNWEL